MPSFILAQSHRYTSAWPGLRVTGALTSAPMNRRPRSGRGAAVLAWPALVCAQQKAGQFQVFVAATAEDGMPVTDLKPEEIAMTENGAPGKVMSLDRHHLPIKLTITVDNGKESENARPRCAPDSPALSRRCPLTWR